MHRSDPTKDTGTYPARSIKVCGTVTDEFGEALTYAKIEVEGYGIKTETDTRGDFALLLPLTHSSDSRVPLRVSYLGYRTREIAINPDSEQWHKIVLETEYGESAMDVENYRATSTQTVTMATQIQYTGFVQLLKNSLFMLFR